MDETPDVTFYTHTPITLSADELLGILKGHPETAVAVMTAWVGQVLIDENSSLTAGAEQYMNDLSDDDKIRWNDFVTTMTNLSQTIVYDYVANGWHVRTNSGNIDKTFVFQDHDAAMLWANMIHDHSHMVQYHPVVTIYCGGGIYTVKITFACHTDRISDYQMKFAEWIDTNHQIFVSNH